MAAKSNLISQLNTASILNSRIQTIHGKISTVNMKYSAIHMLTFFTARRYFSTIYWHDYHKMAQALLPELWAWLLRNGRRNVNTPWTETHTLSMLDHVGTVLFTPQTCARISSTSWWSSDSGDTVSPLPVLYPLHHQPVLGSWHIHTAQKNQPHSMTIRSGKGGKSPIRQYGW